MENRVQKREGKSEIGDLKILPNFQFFLYSTNSLQLENIKNLISQSDFFKPKK